MSRVKVPRTYPGEDTNSIRRSIESLQGFSLEIDTIRKTESYQVSSEDDIVLADATSGNITITLPAIDDAQRKSYYVKKIDSSTNTVTVAGITGETIEGNANIVLGSQYNFVHLIPEKEPNADTPVKLWWYMR